MTHTAGSTRARACVEAQRLDIGSFGWTAVVAQVRRQQRSRTVGSMMPLPLLSLPLRTRRTAAQGTVGLRWEGMRGARSKLASKTGRRDAIRCACSHVWNGRVRPPRRRA